VEHTANVLLQLFALLVAAKIGDEIFKRLRQPALIGEILGGLVVGPSVLGIYQITDETLLFAEIGVVMLLFRVGLETRLHDLLRVGASALAVGMLGVILPFGGGFLLATLLDQSLAVAVFLAAALTATSVGITSRVLADLHAVRTRSGRVILGAAVIDDVLALLILAIAVGIAAGELSPLRIGAMGLAAIAFIAVVLLVGIWLLRSRRSILTEPRFAEGSPFLPGMIIMLGLAAAAAVIGLAAIIGAFLAGMVAGEASEKHALEEQVTPVAAFFTPFFFGAIGAQIDLAGIADLGVLTVLALVTLVAVATKFTGAFLGALSLGRARATLIGWGMVPRGEVGIVVAGIGLQLGAIDGDIYTVVVAMAILTTLLVPPLLPRLLRTAEPGIVPAMRRALGEAGAAPGREREALEEVGPT
jgi:Kef-type K+ transport system membrane component KefB